MGRQLKCPLCNKVLPPNIRGSCTQCRQKVAETKQKTHLQKILLKDKKLRSYICVHCLEKFDCLEKFEGHFKLKQPLCTYCSVLHYWASVHSMHSYYKVGTGVAFIMYIHYEHLPPITNPLTKLPLNMTKFVFSSYTDEVKIVGLTSFDLVTKMVAFIKQIPVSARTLQKPENIWTIPTDSFQALILVWQKMNWIYSGGLFAQKDLFDFVQNASARKQQAQQQSYYRPSKYASAKTLEQAEAEAPSAEDFFYNNAQPVGTGSMPLEQIQEKLIEMLGTTEITKSNYRKAALKYHPDRNHGDGSKMSELNFLYQQYSALTGV